MSNPTCLDLVAEWVQKTFPDIKIHRTAADMPLGLYTNDMWVVSVQYYESVRCVSAWNVSGDQNYIIWADPADPEFFAKLEAFVKRSMEWFQSLSPAEKNRYRVYRLGG